ncbi:membrane protein [Algimonas arctica]|uniref:Membrane protein n=1 Tax=Algimonas arctica TaxID=1479486 RepID=A0A8J3CPT0_9PROT|nr:SIMPL domain-containing protein [Algimonas arctica]GHA83188.1 membrane protein [Algimonas arctica]
MSRLLPTLLVSAAMALPTAALAHSPQTEMPGVIHVTASANVDVIPDLVSVSAGVQSDGKTAQEAMARNSELMRNVFATLAANGIAERDISTTNLNLSPRYDYEQRTNGQPLLVGYRASNQITIASRDLNQTGQLIDSLLQAGLNNINGVNFTVSEPEAAQAQARAAAIEKAKIKARTMAQSANVRLGRLLSLQEGSSPSPIRYNEGMMARSMSADSAPPLAPGEREIGSTVTMSYAILD